MQREQREKMVFQNYIRPFFLLYSSRFNDRRGAVSLMAVIEGLATMGRLANKNAIPFLSQSFIKVVRFD